MKFLKNHGTIIGVTTFVLLLVLQIILGKSGHYVASFIAYDQVDPFNSFAEISIHHAFELVAALLIILILRKLLNLDFYFQLGDKKTGMKSLGIFTLVFLMISIAQHTYMVIRGQLPAYEFPLDARNILGTLGFQLFLSGPAEEIVFRALPIVLLTFSFGRSIKIKGNLTLEVMLASILFAFAHVDWSLSPFAFRFSLFPIIYAFVLGTIQGAVYQRTKSILYPILMHSFSNVLMVGGGYVFTALFS